MSTERTTHLGPISEEVSAFLQQQGEGSEFQLVPLHGGANNRVYRVSRPDGGDWVLKCYFQNPSDSRNRFGAERAFYEWVWSQGIHRTPEPLAWCAEKRLGLFTFVAGRKLRAEEVDSRRVQEALDFLGEINAAFDPAAAKAVPLASEACFSIGEHLDCVDRRISRLQQISSGEAVDRQATAFVEQELSPAWAQIRSAISRAAGKSGLLLDQSIAPGHRCLSPSDFGFHNTILASDDRLRFFDFEYAGWDDPAKLVCDFFCQPELFVSASFWEDFLRELAQRVSADAALPARARLLWPAYKIKWCCIMLNEFVGSEQPRRAFAAGTRLFSERKAAQLAKARQALGKAVELSGGEA